MAQQESFLAMIFRLTCRGTASTVWLVFQLFIWVTAYWVALESWPSWVTLFAAYAASAHLAQIFQEPTLWSGHFRQLAQPIMSGFWRCQVGQATANLFLAAAFLWLVNQLIVQLWDLDLSWLLVIYGLASSIQCLRWRRDDRASFGYKTPAVFLEVARDLIQWFRHRNDPAQDGIAIPSNRAFLDQARRQPAEAGQEPSHLQ